MSSITIKDLGTNLDISSNTSITNINNSIDQIPSSDIQTNTTKHLYKHCLHIKVYSDWTPLEFYWNDNTPSYSTSDWGSQMTAFMRQWKYTINDDKNRFGGFAFFGHSSTTVSVHFIFSDTLSDWANGNKTQTVTPVEYSVTNAQLF